MDVAWTFNVREGAVDVTIDHDFTPPWPVVGNVVSDYIIGPQFVEAIAGKTLATIKGIAQSSDYGSSEKTQQIRQILSH